MCAAYFPTRANEFPNDNPALHQGARWVCRRPLGAPRALLQAPPGSPASLELTSEGSAPSAVAPEAPSAVAPEAPSAIAPQAALAASTESVAASAVSAPSSAESSAPSGAELAARWAGPLQLDLTRIVLPHRVADIPPPPAFIFRSLASARQPDASLAPATFVPVAAPALTVLGYRVVDARVAGSRVERRWRVDIAPCLHVVSELLAPALAELAPVVAASESAALAVAAAAELAPVVAAAESAAPAVAAAELESLAQALFPDAALPSSPVMVCEPDILEPVAPRGAEPSLGLGALLLEPPAADTARPSAKKQQRRRAARVASSAAMAAASASNAELTRTLAEIETAFAERRSEQPRATRNRRSRRAAAKTAPKAAAATSEEAPKKRAANAV